MMDNQRSLARLPAADEMFYSSDLERALLLDFFMLFSRFECALKRARYVRSIDNRSSAGADWDEFAEVASAAWNKGPGPTLLATTTLCSNPPSRQIVTSDKTITWKVVPPVKPSDLHAVLATVRRVRNNLFHGGKYGSGPVKDPARDRSLVDAALCVLKECVSLSSAVEKQFPDDY